MEVMKGHEIQDTVGDINFGGKDQVTLTQRKEGKRGYTHFFQVLMAPISYYLTST